MALALYANVPRFLKTVSTPFRAAGFLNGCVAGKVSKSMPGLCLSGIKRFWYRFFFRSVLSDSECASIKSHCCRFFSNLQNFFWPLWQTSNRGSSGMDGLAINGNINSSNIKSVLKTKTENGKSSLNRVKPHIRLFSLTQSHFNHLDQVLTIAFWFARLLELIFKCTRTHKYHFYDSEHMPELVYEYVSNNRDPTQSHHRNYIL